MFEHFQQRFDILLMILRLYNAIHSPLHLGSLARQYIIQNPFRLPIISTTVSSCAVVVSFVELILLLFDGHCSTTNIPN